MAGPAVWLAATALLAEGCEGCRGCQLRGALVRSLLALVALRRAAPSVPPVVASESPGPRPSNGNWKVRPTRRLASATPTPRRGTFEPESLRLSKVLLQTRPEFASLPATTPDMKPLVRELEARMLTSSSVRRNNLWQWRARWTPLCKAIGLRGRCTCRWGTAGRDSSRRRALGSRMVSRCRTPNGRSAESCLGQWHLQVRPAAG
mmetsp:Transcript_82686/g.230589  ORF Transcript_82686/g.230589 Transcript_82686/m.230589 type:complete len:205 (+) Transcript_82686:126-740(+)